MARSGRRAYAHIASHIRPAPVRTVGAHRRMSLTIRPEMTIQLSPPTTMPTKAPLNPAPRPIVEVIARIKRRRAPTLRNRGAVPAIALSKVLRYPRSPSVDMVAEAIENPGAPRAVPPVKSGYPRSQQTRLATAAADARPPRSDLGGSKER